MRSSAALRLASVGLLLVAGIGHGKPAPDREQEQTEQVFNPDDPGEGPDGFDVVRRWAVSRHVLRVVEPRTGALCTGTIILWTGGQRRLLTAGHCLFVRRAVVDRLDVLVGEQRISLETRPEHIDDGFRGCVQGGTSSAACSEGHADRAMVPIPPGVLAGAPGWPACRPDRPQVGQALTLYAHGLTGEGDQPSGSDVPGMGTFRLGWLSGRPVARPGRQAVHSGDSGGPVILAADHLTAGRARPWVRWTVSGFAEGGAPRLGTTAMLHPMPGPIACSRIPAPSPPPIRVRGPGPIDR